MKKIILRFIAALCLIGAIYATAKIDFFQARSDGENVKVEWQSMEESNLNYYIVERKTVETSFVSISQNIDPKGSYSYYEFVDKNAYKASDLIFIYRLKIVDNNNVVTYSDEVSVTPDVSGVKRTWGSIKAMFR